VTEEVSPAVQDYLKALFMLAGDAAEDGDPGELLVSTTAVAERLRVSAASATNMLKKLETMGMVTYVPYKGAHLTEAGKSMSLEVIRHHRLLETYLVRALGVPWDKVHAEAEILEHVLSEDLEERISAALGHPDSDPHGHPIPAKDGSMPPRASGRPLWDGERGERLKVERVSDSEDEVLRYLAGIGIRPGVFIRVVDKGPLAGPLFVQVEGDSGEEIRALSKELAKTVWVAGAKASEEDF
jgi:DtxR family transcriptional regulator, Mn-dependent transcriptional regulator